MKIIVGLGNPGEKYQNNRHNVGFKVIDKIMENGEWRIENGGWERKFGAEIIKINDLLLVKPQTFMNDSGKAVAEIVNFYKVKTEDLWLIHDDLDIKLGEYKIQRGIGPKVHNGVNSVEESLGQEDFWRVRVGVDNRMENGELKIDNERRIKGEDYVLADFTEEENKVLGQVIDKITAELIEKLS